MYFDEYMYSFLLGIYLGMELLDQRGCTCSHLVATARVFFFLCFFKWLYQCIISPAVYEREFWITLHAYLSPILGIFSIFHFSHIMVLICIFGWVMMLSMSSFVYWLFAYCFLWRAIQSFCPFLIIGLLTSFLQIFFMYSKWVLCRIYIFEIFLSTLGLTFSVLMVFLDEQNFLV